MPLNAPSTSEASPCIHRPALKDPAERASARCPAPCRLPYLAMAVFADAPEYSARTRVPVATPPPSLTLTIKAVYAAVPKHLFRRSTSTCLFYVGCHVLLSICFYLVATHINDLVFPTLDVIGIYKGGRAEYATVWVMWGTYWFWQSVAFVWT